MLNDHVMVIMIRFLCIIMVSEIVLACPKSNIKFEKIIGLSKAIPNNPQLLFHLNPAEPKRPITLDCLNLCLQNDKCQSFVLHYDSFECYWFLSDVTHSLSQRLKDDVDDHAAWFIKVCLDVAADCQKSWIFETVRGATLIGNNTKTIPNQTRIACQQSCLNEKDFECKSLKFQTSLDYESKSNNESFGQCVLSDSDRHLMPNAYRVSTYDDYYLENQCAAGRKNIDSNGDFCAYEEYDNVTLPHGDLIVTGTKENCQSQCDNLDSFNCRGYTLSQNNCILHSEDTKLRGPRLLTPSQNSYFEKARCLNISVSCSDSFMAVRYQPENDFHGKLYMQGYSENPECFVVGRGGNVVVTLKIPLLTSQCGIVRAESFSNRTLMAGNLILQYNALIQTQSDRILKVGCIFGNQSKILIGTGINITSSLPNKGSTLLNTASNETVAPKVEMKIVDMRTQQEATDTQIGQELQLIIELKEMSNTLDFWASHLIAMTEKGEESIFLLDDRGCPTNLNIFPALQKNTDEGGKRLVATFQAFKFAVSPVVRFSVIVMFCPEHCMSIECDNGIQSFGRRKREINAHILDTINGRTMISTKPDFPSTVVNQMPLEYVLIVRDSSSNPDRLILGMDGKILVAGYNYATNEVCMDYSLVIGLIVTWILVQLIFIITSVSLVRRYKKHYELQYNRASLDDLHKNFGLGFSNLDNRRVRWADNGEHIL